MIPTFVIESNNQHQYYRGLELEGGRLKGLAHKTPLQHTCGGLENYPAESGRYFFCNVYRRNIMSGFNCCHAMLTLLFKSLEYGSDIHVVI